MKIVEIENNVSVMVTNEEVELLKWFQKKDKVNKENLSEHQQLIANQLVIKDLLTRQNLDGQIVYKRSTR